MSLYRWERAANIKWDSATDLKIGQQQIKFMVAQSSKELQLLDFKIGHRVVIPVMATRVTCPLFIAQAGCPVRPCCPNLTTWQGTRIVVPTMTVKLWQTLLQWLSRWKEIELLRFVWSTHISSPWAMACLVSISQKTDLVIPRLSCRWQADTIHYIRDLGAISL